ncbi:hypothetical protein [Streptomyces sp. E2N166]|uniref:hypothetical protein n=1 Tax=Streptomyces sp. E2N166 TaxID=1851909 RepID=UPI001EE8515E|nr:hypothetical protein [Streptomyces sp. E2N166]
MGALLALASAVCYGVVTFLGQVGGLVLACVAALLVTTPGVVRTADLLWGALRGVSSGVAMHFLNRGLSRGATSVVVPVSAVTVAAVLLPLPAAARYTGRLRLPSRRCAAAPRHC